jgi:heme A synthase
VAATLAFLHGYGARVLVAFAVVLALWGTYAYIRNTRLSGGFRSSYLIMVGVTGIQGLLGLTTLLMGNRPHELLHIVYGIFAILFLPGAYVYANAGSQRRETLVLAGACWIVTIAYLRGIATGG